MRGFEDLNKLLGDIEGIDALLENDSLATEGLGIEALSRGADDDHLRRTTAPTRSQRNLTAVGIRFTGLKQPRTRIDVDRQRIWPGMTSYFAETPHISSGPPWGNYGLNQALLPANDPLPGTRPRP